MCREQLVDQHYTDLPGATEYVTRKKKERKEHTTLVRVTHPAHVLGTCTCARTR